MTGGRGAKDLAQDDEAAMRDIDISVPHIARMYDYWLGGYFLYS